MGFRSNVYIKCEEKAFELFKDAFSKAEQNPDSLEKTENDIYKFSWNWIKWNQYYGDIQVFEDILSQLCSEEFDLLEGYAFKAIWIHEDDSTEIRMNSSGDNAFEDFYITVDVSEYFSDSVDESLLE